MKFIRHILIFLVPFYYLVTWVRNKLYDLGIQSSKSYDFPVICVGNLNVGGTGKTPMIEYLIRLLKDSKKVATLSRGYKRQSKGFVLADTNASPLTLGDEPFQFHSKFPDIQVAVDADRRRGIQRLLSQSVKPKVILLDDAYQHRKVKAGLNVLLTAHDKLYTDDILLPTGDLREPRSGVKRAQIIIVTKCPIDLGKDQKEIIRSKLGIRSDQLLFFSRIKYDSHVYNNMANMPLLDLTGQSFTLVTGIADPSYLVDFLNEGKFEFEHMDFKDHHDFNNEEIDLLNSKSLVVTTEKDYVRLREKTDSQNIWYLPIAVEIDRKHKFDKRVLNFVEN
ncbi:MAG: tetraacyldisaccharide 4'-kinase [Flavobacteriaceae bacterium]|nr:tetraacyldisaccharide 4'-kinase [Flavobacteriaceae bacterium]